MKKLSLVYIGFVFLTMAACSESASDEADLSGNIQLGVTVGDLQINSRAGVTAVPYLPQEGKTFEAAVWFRKYDGDYENKPDASINLPVHTTVEFDGSQLKYVFYDNKNLKYPTDNTNVCCIGLYPKLNWETTDNKVVSHSINGAEDLMFASEIEGSWNRHFPPQQYEHLLTWIKINICASSHDAVDAWGMIEQIYVTSDSEVQIDLKNGSCQYVSPQLIPAMNSSKLLSTSIQEVGSVFCSPEKEYKVTVETKNKSGVVEKRTIPLTLNLIDVEHDDKITNVTQESQAKGKCFVFSLYFTPHNVIDGVGTLNSWSNQNEDIYLD
ncbi:hypothetical protein AB9N12_02795 [Bacteroides sp. AN502(2024)]|uniref:hypothetical protein n=1 Tax=Bacteroides sp. AN502(2024) TaxID=3160599 RepID=UPI003512430E